MSVQRELEAGPLLAAAGAVLAIVALFLDWYGTFSAWTIFEVLDLVVAGLALAAIASALSGFGLPRWVPVRALPLIGAAAFVVVASQLVNHPPAGTDRDLEIGAWLGLVGAVAMLVGGLVSVARVSFAVNVSERPAREQPPGVAPSAPSTPDAPPPAPAPQDPPPPPPPPPPPSDPDDETHRLGGQ